MWFTASRRTHRLDFDISYGHGEDGGGDEGHGAWIWYWTHLHLDATRLTLQVEIYRRVIHWEDNGRHTGWTLTSVQLQIFWYICADTCRSWKIPPVRTSLAGTTSTVVNSPASFSSISCTHSSSRRVTSLHLQVVTQEIRAEHHYNTFICYDTTYFCRY